MKTVVIGGGVVGVTTAWYLATDGHDVTVIERLDHPAGEASYNNAGMIAPGHSFAWASPRVPKVLLQSLWRNDTAFRFSLSLDPDFYGWGMKFLRECNAERARANTLVKHDLCRYSQEKLLEIVDETGIDYHREKRGLLFFYRDPAHFAQGQANMKILTDNGQDFSFLDAAEVVAMEPALATIEDKLAGAVHAPTDETGDCARFVAALTGICRGMGVDFRLGTTATRMVRNGAGLAGIETDKGMITGERYVLALGAWAAPLAKTAGVKLPVYPVKGYSVTYPIVDQARAPKVGGVDEGMLIAYAPLGDRLRMTATAHFSGYDTRATEKDCANMLKVARELFPDCIDHDAVEFRGCLRPMTPDGPPILGQVLGPSGVENLWLNAGQGHMGWTMATGSSRIVTDMMAGRTPNRDLKPLALERYS